MADQKQDALNREPVVRALMAIVAFVFGIWTYALVGPIAGSLSPLIQAAIVTAIGATFAALAARYAVVRASQVAAAESRQDRQLARDDRFADRVATVAARLMNTGFDLSAAIEGQLADWRAGEPELREVPSMETVRRLVFELRMIVRTDRTYQAVVDYSQMLYDVADFDYDADARPSVQQRREESGGLVRRSASSLIHFWEGLASNDPRRPYPADIDARWEATTARLKSALIELEDAVRAETDRSRLPRDRSE